MLTVCALLRAESGKEKELETRLLELAITSVGFRSPFSFQRLFDYTQHAHR